MPRVTGDTLAPAGWYADPYGGLVLRYWDGAQWTDYIHVRFGEDVPRDAVAAEFTWAPWVRRAWLALPFTHVLGAAGSLYAIDGVVDDFRRGWDTAEGPRFSMGASPLQLFGWVGAAIMVLIYIWAFRAATAGRALGIPAPRKPPLVVVGWIVPVIQLWWPYQSVRALVPPDEGMGPLVGWWWASFLAQGVLGLGMFVLVAFVSVTAALWGLIPLAVVAIAYAVLGTRITNQVLAVHERELIARRLAGPEA